jgi:hypothetical protein
MHWAAPAAQSIQENEMQYLNIEFVGIDHSDYPDFCDAFICYAEHDDGEPLTDDELDLLNDDGCFVHEALWNHLF